MSSSGQQYWQELTAEEMKTQGFREDKLAAFSFTDAVRNLFLNQLQEGEISFLSEEAEEGTCEIMAMTEYAALRDYMEDHLEELCLREIENTLEQYCGIPGEALYSDSEDGLWDQNMEKATFADNSDNIDSSSPLDFEPLAESSALDPESNDDSLNTLERESYVDSLTAVEWESSKIQGMEPK